MARMPQTTIDMPAAKESPAQRQARLAAEIQRLLAETTDELERRRRRDVRAAADAAR